MEDFLGIEKSMNIKLESNSRQRDYYEAKKNGLFDFGERLYQGGYDIDEFFSDAMICFIAPEDQITEVYNNIRAKYSTIDKFPSLDSITTLAFNKNYIQAIRNGYNRAKRLETINNNPRKK